MFVIICTTEYSYKNRLSIHINFLFSNKQKLNFFFEIQYLEKYIFFSLKLFPHQKDMLSFNTTESLVANIFCFRVMIF